MSDPLELRIIDTKTLRAECENAGKHLSVTTSSIINEKTKKLYCSHCATLYSAPLTKQERRDYLNSRKNTYKPNTNR